jgi:hypothetical protein
VLVVIRGWTRDDAKVKAQVEDVLIILRGKLEAKSVTYLLEKFGTLSADSNELEFIPARFEGGQVRRHDPRPCADHADSETGHDALRRTAGRVLTRLGVVELGNVSRTNEAPSPEAEDSWNRI